MAVKSWKRASWRESVVELGVQRIADQQSAIIIGGLGKEEKKGASKGGAEGQRERDREVGERGQKKKGERKGDDRRGIEPIFHARIHLEGYDGRPGGRSVAFAFVGY